MKKMAEPSRPENIPGYDHPTTLNSQRSSKYKTFTEGKRKRKNEKFGTTTLAAQYVKYGDLDAEHCPVCDEPPALTCPCGFSDKHCGKGHVWYTDRDGETKVGDPHKKQE